MKGKGPVFLTIQARTRSTAESGVAPPSQSVSTNQGQPAASVPNLAAMVPVTLGRVCGDMLDAELAQRELDLGRLAPVQHILELLHRVSGLRGTVDRHKDRYSLIHR